MPVRLGRVLVVDDDPDTADLLTTILSDAGYEAVGALTGGDGLMMLEVESPGQGDADLARATLRRGAVDYIRKPMNPEHLLCTVAAALRGRATLSP